MKYFIITVDTEGDNQWTWKPGMPITTTNTGFIGRFQSLCERYSFLPVYLTNYEMIMDEEFCGFAESKSQEGLCEVGMHIHAWFSPPDFELQNRFGGQPFITEYPNDVVKEKLAFLKQLIVDRVGVEPVSFRSGRWATNEVLFKMLDELGFLVDCSITPGISNYTDKGMSVEHGNDYTKEKIEIKSLSGKLIEIPMTTKRIRTLQGTSVKNRARNVILGKDIWLRPAINTFDEMKKLCDSVEESGIPYLEFMIHSTELMPGGSPYTKTESDVEVLYERMEKLFEYVSDRYTGITLAQYYPIAAGELSS